MKTAYIFHDAFCDQFSDWYPWMKSSLESQGYIVVVPSFPTPAGQSYPSWKAVIKNYLDKFDGETMFIGHGTGGVFAMRLLSEMNTSINGLFLVASYGEPIGHVGYDRVNETFLNIPIAWDKVKTYARVIQIFSGEKDPFVPTAVSEKLATNLGQELHVIPGGEHLNKASGFTQIIPVLQSIMESGEKLDKTIEVETPAPVIEQLAPQTHPAGFAERPSLIERTSSVETLVGTKVNPLHDNGEGGLRSKPGEGAHTMYQDMSGLVNSNQGSVASSLLNKARTDAEVKKIQQPLSSKNIPYIIGIIAIILIIVGIGSFVLNRTLPAAQKQSATIPTSLILAESHTRVDLIGESYAVIKKIRDTLTASNREGITDVYYTNGMLRASFPSVLSKLGITTLPETLTNEFPMPQAGTTPLFMHGAGSLNGTPVHFLVLPVAHYDNAFTGMKEWEPTLARDLGIFMNASEEAIKTRATKDAFVDQVINNRQMRVLKDPAGNPLMVYFFLTEHMIVVTDNVVAIPEVLKRFANSQIYR